MALLNANEMHECDRKLQDIYDWAVESPLVDIESHNLRQILTIAMFSGVISSTEKAKLSIHVKSGAI